MPNGHQLPRKTISEPVGTPGSSRPKSVHLDQASRESKNTENEELKSLKESFVAMAIVARWEGERREHLSLLKSNETKSKLELKTRLEELRNVEKVRT